MMRIEAVLTGEETIEAAGIVLKHRTPILAMARRLLEAGHAPAVVLACRWVDGAPTITQAIGDLAYWTVTETDRVRRFAKWVPNPMFGERDAA